MTTDRHKTNPVTFRPPDGDRAWLYQHAEQTGQSASAILTEALQELRKRLENSDAAGDGVPASRR